jgi:putative chitinase
MSEDSDRLAEESRQTKEALAAVREELSAVSAELDRLTGGAFSMDTSFRRMRGSSDDITGAFVRGRTSSDRLFGSFDSLNEAQKAIVKSMQDEAVALALRKQAFNNLGQAVGSLTSALLTAGGGLAKYNTTIDKAGDAASNFLRSLGPVGKVMGLVVDGATFAAKQLTVYGDNLLKASDELASFGVAGTLTTEQIRKMGEGALYTSTTIGSWTKATKSLGTDIIGLSSTVTGGVTEFSKLTQMTREQYNAYQAMGLSQEAVTQAQADSVKYMMKSGQIVTEKMKVDGTLRLRTMDYITDLEKLAAITGQSVEDAKKTKEAAVANVGVQIHLAELEMRANDLRARGMTEEADKLDAERKNSKELLEISKTKMSAERFAGLQQMVTTGNFTELSASFARANPGILEFIQKVKEGSVEAGMIGPELAKGTKAAVESLGTAGKYNEEVAKQFGMSVEEFANYTQNAQRLSGKAADDYAKALKDAKEKVDLAAKTKGEGGTSPAVEDPLQKARVIAFEAEQKLQTLRDQALSKLIDSMGIETLAVAAGAVAVGTMAAAAVAAASALSKLSLSSLAGGGKGGLDFPDITGSGAKGARGVGKLPMKALRMAGPAAAAISVGADMYGAYEGYKDTEADVKAGRITKAEGTVKKSEAVGEGAGSAAGGAIGAVLGGMGGSIIPVLGTAIGSAAGAWIGSKAGGWLGKMAGGVVGTDISNKDAVEAKKKKADEDYIDAKEKATMASKASAAALEKAIDPLKKFTGEVNDATRALAKDEIEIVSPESVPKPPTPYVGTSTAGAGRGAMAPGRETASTPYVGTSTAGAGRGAVVPGTEMKPEDASSVEEAKQLGASLPERIPFKAAPEIPQAKKVTAPEIPQAKKVTAPEIPQAKNINEAAKNLKESPRMPFEATSIPQAKEYGAATPQKGLDNVLLDKLAKAGVIDAKSQANVMAQVKAESGGIAKSENLRYTPEQLLRTFPNRIKSIEDARQLVEGGQEAIGNRIYGGRMGNDKDEGYKYRGRGLIQLTGKDNYAKYGKMIGVDLVKEPDKANDPDIARDIAVAYFKDKQKHGTDLASSKSVSKAVGHVDIGGEESAKRERMALAMQEKIQGNQPDQPERVATIKRQQPPQAREGGIFSGSKNGFPVELHGNELVAPLDPTSIIAKLLMAPSSESMPKIAEATKAEPVAPIEAPNTGLTVDMIEMLAGKLDAMISKLSDSHDTQEKLLQYSRV